jgi:hypothetical protein
MPVTSVLQPRYLPVQHAYLRLQPVKAAGSGVDQVTVKDAQYSQRDQYSHDQCQETA